VAAIWSEASLRLRIVSSLGLRLVLFERRQANTEELEHGRALIVSMKGIGVWKLGAGESGGLPELAGGRDDPWRDVCVGVWVVFVAGRQAVGCSGRVGLCADLDGDVEMLGPELHAGRVGVGWSVRVQFLED
jgi:hypothetical protein